LIVSTVIGDLDNDDAILAMKVFDGSKTFDINSNLSIGIAIDYESIIEMFD
jgi:hypothetical protein